MGWFVVPPSITSVCPVIHEAASDSRNSAPVAMSSDSPRRRNGSFAAIFDGMKGKGPAQQSELEDTDVTFNIVSGNEEDD